MGMVNKSEIIFDSTKMQNVGGAEKKRLARLLFSADYRHYSG